MNSLQGKQIIILLCALLMLGILPAKITAQINVFHVDEEFNASQKRGVYYTLPQTVLKIKLKVRQTIKLEGPFSGLADKYLGLEEVITRDEISYKISEISVSSASQPDPGQVYFIEYGEKPTRDIQEMLLSFRKNGVILGADIVEGEDEMQHGEFVPEKGIDTDSISRYFRRMAGENLKEKIDTLVRKITIDTLNIEKLSFKTRIMEKSDEDRAREAVEMIKSLRSYKINILTGYQEVAYSREAMAYMVDELTKIEDEYLDLFRGKIFSYTYTYSFTHIPALEDVDNWVPVVRFSEKDGIANQQSSNDEDIFLLLSKTGGKGMISDKIAPTQGNNRGLFFRCPETMHIMIRHKDQVSDLMDMNIAQFGTVVQLPPNAQSMNFYGETGGVKSVIIRY